MSNNIFEICVGICLIIILSIAGLGVYFDHVEKMAKIQATTKPAVIKSVE